MSVAKKVEPISQATVRNLNDKLYDKRKLGAVEIEQQIKELNKQQDNEKIMEILVHLGDSFIRSTSVSSRKGGLIALAAAALGLGTVRSTYDHSIQLTPPQIELWPFFRF
jgi:vacuole morphology and inheritance protein 14